MTDAKPMMLPVEEYADDDTMTLYDYAFSRKGKRAVGTHRTA